MAYSHNIREEELKNLIARDWLSAYNTAHILGDFPIGFFIYYLVDKVPLAQHIEPKIYQYGFLK